MLPIYFAFSVQIVNSNLFSCNMVYFKHPINCLAHSFQALQYYCFIFFDLMTFTVLILIDSCCAFTNHLLFYFLVDENFDSVSQAGSTV